MTLEQDRRERPRLPSELLRDYTTTLKCEDTVLKGRTVNLSPSGVGLLTIVASPLEVGQHVTGELSGPGFSVPLGFLGQVVHVGVFRDDVRFWMTGVRFLTPLDLPDELRDRLDPNAVR
jgi:PilZ domain